MTQLHATAVALDGIGVLIRGPSGSGKSDLALRLIDDGADLIADDRVELDTVDGKLHLTAPVTIRGLIEVRGIGLVNIGAVQDVPLALIVELKPRDKTERLPEVKEELIDGITIPVIDIDAFEISAPAKIKMALHIQDGKASLIE
ncbi:MAG: aldolase [Rhodospirillaceae bacterium]|jgi:HPr kinase/phosphorylase|nr:aldolase [Rhodospirillaceae bacterium]MBT4588139.1 aldolase [Rhodospirillaceae bacterium]MBT4938585.1 aldolase [Rhodospirillaceae bacterium]MBT5939470.1 aldolase [Rhodospirillaceae bacterium]MBT7266787.1 aldolase [Rhodospirillaceae bacterium]